MTLKKFCPDNFELGDEFGMVVSTTRKLGHT